MRRLGCHPLNPLGFSVCTVDGEESRHVGRTRKERKNKHFGQSGGPVWWLLLTQVWPCHLRMITFTELSMAHNLQEVGWGQKATGTKIWKTFWKYVTCTRVHFSLYSFLFLFQEGKVEEESNSLYTATEPFTPPGDYDQTPLCLQLLWTIRIIH